jgi:hypothetical protein
MYLTGLIKVGKVQIVINVNNRQQASW